MLGECSLMVAAEAEAGAGAGATVFNGAAAAAAAIADEAIMAARPGVTKKPAPPPLEACEPAGDGRDTAGEESVPGAGAAAGLAEVPRQGRVGRETDLPS